MLSPVSSMAINTSKVQQKENTLSSRNKTLVIILATSLFAYLLLHETARPSRSLLLYTNYSSPESITNWIVDTDTGQKWEVGKGLAAWHWSPSGKYLMFYTLSPLPLQAWISNADGTNLRQALNSEDYPNLEIKNFDWFSDEIILVNVVNKTENSGFVYTLNINTLSFERLQHGNFVSLPVNGKWWIQWADQHYEIAVLSGRTTYMSDNLSEYYFSPNGEKIAYSCAGEGRYSSICVADVNICGVTNEHKFLNMRTHMYAFGEMKWSPDGKYLSFLCSPNRTETHFCAIEISNGTIVYNWAFPTKDALVFWSPRGDKIIDWGGVLLDLKTGQVGNFFAEIGETTPSYIVDWRMIEVP